MIFKRLLQSTSRNVAFAFDIDGVLFRGKTPIPGAGDALKLLNQNKIPYILLTNGGGYLESERSAFISKALGVDISPLQTVLSHSPYKTLVNKYDRVLTVGTEGVRKVAESYGFKDVVHQTDVLRYDRAISPFSGISDQQLMKCSKVIPDIDRKKFDAVLVFNDPHDWASDIQIILDALNSENGMLGTCRMAKSSTPSVPIYFSNQDLLWASEYSLNRFGQGAFRLLIRKLYSALNGGLQLEDFTIGKPTKLTYDFAHHVLINWRRKLIASELNSSELNSSELNSSELNSSELNSSELNSSELNSSELNSSEQNLPPLGVSPQDTPFDNVYMVGDNPASDIIGAQRYGWDSCLVRTGVYQDGTTLGSVKPTMIVDNVYQAVTKVLEQS